MEFWFYGKSPYLPYMEGVAEGYWSFGDATSIGTAESEGSESSDEVGGGYVGDNEPGSPGAGGLGQVVQSDT